MNGDLRPLGTRSGLDWTSFNWWGLFMVLIGILWLGDGMGWFKFNWSMMAPIALVFAGVMALIPRRRHLL
jgi:hypothetical protein